MWYNRFDKRSFCGCPRDAEGGAVYFIRLFEEEKNMKRRLAIALLLVLALSLMLPSLGGCADNSDDAVSSENGGAIDNAENSDGKQIPVYKGMTVSPADGSSEKAD